MMLYLPLIFTCALFLGKVEGLVTWNRTKLESFQPGIEPSWNHSNLESNQVGIIPTWSRTKLESFQPGVEPTTSTPPEQDCPGGYSLVGDKCLLFVTFAAEPYGEARQFCHAAKGELAAITTATDFKNLVDYIHDNDFSGADFWLDGSDEAEEGVWVTSSGEAVPLGTPFWAAFPGGQQPDNSNGNEHCLFIPSGWFFYMADTRCSVVKNFICEATNQMRKETASAALTPFGPSAVGGRVSCPILFIEVGGLCLMFVTWAEETWEDAQRACGGASSELLAITDVEVFRAVYLYIHLDNLSSHAFWLGGSDVASEGTWVYTTGEPVPMGTPFWGIVNADAPAQEPEGGTKQNCLAITGEGYFNFRDYPCASKFNPLCVYTG